MTGLSGWSALSLVLSHFDERRDPLVGLSNHGHHGSSVTVLHFLCPNASFFRSLSPVGRDVLAESRSPPTEGGNGVGGPTNGIEAKSNFAA